MVTKYCSIVLIFLFIHHSIHAISTSSLALSELPDFNNTIKVTTIMSSQHVLGNKNVERLLDSFNRISKKKVEMVSMIPLKQSSVDRRFRHKNHNFSVEPYCSDSCCNANDPGMAILNSAYAKVTSHLRMIQDTMKKNLDVMMTLNMLKGMLMEEGMRSQDKKLHWQDYSPGMKTLFDTSLHIYDKKSNKEN